MLIARGLTWGMRVGWSSVLLSAAAAFLTATACGPVPAGASTSVSVLAPVVVETSVASVHATGTTPADGRLRGPDYTAVLTEVAWPQAVDGSGGSQLVAGTDDRLVAFALSVTQAAAAAGILEPSTTVSASLKVGPSTLPVSMATIDGEIGSGTPGDALTTGTDGFTAAVPAHQHKIVLILSEGSFSQSFDMWTLTRLPLSPAILYRDRRSSDVSGSPSGAMQLNFMNPDDGFMSTDSTDVSSADLTWFAPDGSGTTPTDRNNAFLVVNLQSAANDGYSAVNDGGPGDFFSSFNPLPTNMLTFTPAGGTPITATTAPLTSSTGQSSGGDGLFDALYWFTVPATTTTGTLTVAAGTVSGLEYTGYEANGNNVPITITAPESTTLSFSATTPPAHQAKPAWVGAPLPPTGTGAALAGGSATGSIQPGGGFPIWLAVLLLVVVAAAVVLAQRWLARRGVPQPVVSSSSFSTAMTQLVTEPSASEPTPVPTTADEVPTAPPAPAPVGDPMLKVFGPVKFDAYRQVPERRIVEELLCWLVLHNADAHNADEIQLSLRPTDGPRAEVSRKTFHSYLSGLRQCVGADHLPDATNAGGYRINGIDCDWSVFGRLADEADNSVGPVSIELRTRALALVRGTPFQGVARGQYEWVFNEDLHIQMSDAVVTCALRLSNDLMALGRYNAAEDAARAGLRGAPEDPYLKQARDRAVVGRNEGLVHPGHEFPLDPEAPEDPGDTQELGGPTEST